MQIYYNYCNVYLKQINVINSNDLVDRKFDIINKLIK